MKKELAKIAFQKGGIFIENKKMKGDFISLSAVQFNIELLHLGYTLPEEAMYYIALKGDTEIASLSTPKNARMIQITFRTSDMAESESGIKFVRTIARPAILPHIMWYGFIKK